MYAIVMLMILLANGAGFYVYYSLQLRQIRVEMRQALKLLPDHELQVLTLTRTEFEEALVEEDEVKVKGKMYDIARIQAEGDVITIYGLHDEKEDNLFALLREIIGKPIKDRSAMPSQVIQFLSLNFILSSTSFVFWNDAVPITNISGYSFSSGIRLPEKLDPPPRS
jgi:hypothetical protein